MRIFGGLTDCECGCDIVKKSSDDGGPVWHREEPVADQCCDGDKDACCTDKEDDPETRPGLWARYLDRLKKAIGWQPPKCH